MVYKEKLLFSIRTLNRILSHYIIPECSFVDVIGIDNIKENWTEDECEKVFKQIWDNVSNVDLFNRNEPLPDILSRKIKPFCIFNKLKYEKEVKKDEMLCNKCRIKHNCDDFYYKYFDVIRLGDVYKICDYFFIKSLLFIISNNELEFKVSKLISLIKNEIDEYLEDWAYSLGLLCNYDFNNMLQNIYNTCFDFKEILMSIVNYKLNEKRQKLEELFGKTIRFNNE